MFRRLSASLGFVDQAIASLRPLILTLIVLRATSPHGFGVFALVTAALLMATGVSNAFHAQVLLVRAGYEHTGRSAGSVLAWSVIGGSCVLLLAATTWWEPWTLVAVAVSLPLFLLFDFGRTVAHGRRRYVLAMVMDVSWLIASAVMMVVLQLRYAVVDPAMMVLAWSLGALPGAILATHRFGLWRWLASGPVGWWRRGSQLGGTFTIDFALMSAAGQAGKYATGALGDVAGAGSLRAGELLGSPLSTLTQAMRLHVLGKGGHLVAARDQPAVRRLIRSSILWMLTACVVYYSILGVGSTTVLPSLFGDQWDEVWRIFGAVVVASVGRSLASSGLMALQLTGERRVLLRTRSLDAGLTLALSVAGAALYGYVGAAWGLAIANAIMAPVWLLAAQGSLRRQQ